MSVSFRKRLLVKSDKFDEILKVVYEMYHDNYFELSNETIVYLSNVQNYLWRLSTLASDYFDSLHFISIHVNMIKSLKCYGNLTYIIENKNKIQKQVVKANAIKKVILDEYKI